MLLARRRIQLKGRCYSLLCQVSIVALISTPFLQRRDYIIARAIAKGTSTGLSTSINVLSPLMHRVQAISAQSLIKLIILQRPSKKAPFPYKILSEIIFVKKLGQQYTSVNIIIQAEQLVQATISSANLMPIAFIRPFSIQI